MTKYWKSIEEYHKGVNDDHAHLPDRIQMQDSLKASRRDFLKLFGFGVASAAVLASCERPVKKAIPLLIQPEEIRPGIASYYASTFYNGNEAVPILVKVRDGRPIKIEGNELCELTHGGTSAQVQASLLNLYDESRPKQPLSMGNKVSWDQVNSEIVAKLKDIADDQEIVFLTQSIISPSLKDIIAQLANQYSNFNVVTLDSYSYSGIREAYLEFVGESMIPFFQFHKADVIVSFGADFLGTWLSPTVFTNQYVQNRKLDDAQGKLSKHIQYESVMSLTGSNADYRYVIMPSEEGKYILSLYNVIAKRMHLAPLMDGGFETKVEKTAEQLVNAQSKALVVSGSNQKEIQLLVAGINKMLNNFGHTIRLDKTFNTFQGNDQVLTEFKNKCINNKVGAVICYESNPVYHLISDSPFGEMLKNLELSVNITSQKDETSAFCQYVLPANHFLEAWDDAEAVSGHFSLTQPVIQSIYNTKDIHQILTAWLGEELEAYTFIKQYWEDKILEEKAQANSFVTLWKKTLSDGVYRRNKNISRTVEDPDLQESAAYIRKVASVDGLEFMAYQSVTMGDGKMANNPWLQELPDPVGRVCWDNYFAVSPVLAKQKEWSSGDVIDVDGVLLPVFIQPGQHDKVISAALGYGRSMEAPEPEKIGVDVKPLFMKNKVTDYYISVNQVSATGTTYELATTQTHHSMEGRALIRETSLSEYLHNPASGNELHAEVEKLHTSLYNNHDYKGHHWALFVDLNSCTGCNACVVACSVENNVPVVGRNEVRRLHEMHWLRIDRYYTGSVDHPEALRVVRQPVMCQHCDNAPCENVCPVAATNHSSEGINQMAYNRCIGTRYCNNNCPYKVRRFNWYDYTGADSIPFNRKDAAGMSTDLKRMVLNPDVVVRAKGVIEKCSFCIQRIQEGKLEAKNKGSLLQDGDIKTACQQACPAKAITFGDMNDEHSVVSKMMKDPRRYHLLEELHTLPSVAYLTRVRNIQESVSNKSEHKTHS
jgi:molybdopterin-containing oxidoreductase family iron-sulfur binding subunit